MLFVFDLTASMGEELSIMQTESQNIMNSLLESVSDSAFGVASFMDYPDYGGYSSDYPWKLNKGITTNTNAVRDSINGLTLGDGGYYPEAYTRALYETYADSGVNWRTDAKKIVIMFGDAVPHDIDPGRDGKVGTADDLDFEEVVAELKSQGITVLALHAGTDDRPWVYMADETGGTYYKLTEASKIPEAVTSMLVAEVDKIGELTLRAEPDYESWVSYTPNKYTNVGAKTTKTFTVKVTVPEGTKGGTYKFNIDVLGDGTVLGSQRVTVTVREPTPRPSDVVTPTPTREPTPTPKRTRTYTSTPKPTRIVVPTSTPTPTREPISSPSASLEAAISVLPASHNFGRMYVTGTSSPLMFAITNTGSEDLWIGYLSITGVADDEFRIQDNNCRSKTLAQSRSCTVNVLFAPTSEGEKRAKLCILSNDPETPILDVPLQGTAVISEQESQLRNCNVAIKESGDTIISFFYDLSPLEEAAWLAARFEIAKTIEHELRRIYDDAAVITISARETTVMIPKLVVPTDNTYTMPELDLQEIQQRYQQYHQNLTNISIVPTTVTIEFPDKYTETFVETDIVPETTHTISGTINPWIKICSPPSGAKLRNATAINVWGSDDLQRVSLMIKGMGWEKRWEADSPPFYFEWDLNDTNVSGGSYKIEATGFVDDEGDVFVTDTIIVDIEKPMVPPATLFGVLIVCITAIGVAAGAAATSLRTTTETHGRHGNGKWDVKLSLNYSILYGKYRTTIIGDILRVMLSIGILSFAYTLQSELPKRTVETFSIFYKEVSFQVPTLEGFGPNALSTFFSILVLVGFILLVREFVQHFLAWVLDAEVGAVIDKTSTILVLGSGLFGSPFGKPMRTIIWEDLSPRVKGLICLGNILCLGSLFAFFNYAVSEWLSDGSWVTLIENIAIPAVAMLLITSLLPFGGKEGTVIFEWNKPLAISLFVISGLLYISLILHWIDPLIISFILGLVALAGLVILIGGLLFYKFMEWINLV